MQTKPAGEASGRWAAWALCAVFGAVFVYAGAVKIAEPILFLEDVRSFRLLADPFAAWLALGLPWLELLAGLAVITGLFRGGGLLLLNGLLVVFLVVIAISWLRGLDISCGCFGGPPEPADYVTLVARDLLLLALGATAWRLWAVSGVRSGQVVLHPSSLQER
jgi:putative oxidoreductase